MPVSDIASRDPHPMYSQLHNSSKPNDRVYKNSEPNFIDREPQIRHEMQNLIIVFTIFQLKILNFDFVKSPCKSFSFTSQPAFNSSAPEQSINCILINTMQACLYSCINQHTHTQKAKSRATMRNIAIAAQWTSSRVPVHHSSIPTLCRKILLR